MKIYIIRHGETEFNTQRRYQGVTDVPLSERGLSRLRRADIASEYVYVSPLSRARQTAAALFPDAEQIPIPQLAEMNFGIFEGRTHDEMEDEPAYIEWINSHGLAQIPGGECKADFVHRVAAGFELIVDRELAAGAETVVVVAHGGTQMAVLERYSDTGWDYYGGLASYAGGWVLETDSRRWGDQHNCTVVGPVCYLAQS